MGRWVFYDATNGTLTGRSFTGPAELVAINTPPGCAPLELADDVTVPSAHNRRVDLRSGRLVAWQPPAPPDDALRTWAWDAQAERWLSVPTLQARKAQASAAVLTELRAEDAAAIRPLSELVTAMAQQAELPAEAVTRLAQVQQRKAALRAALVAIDSAKDAAELERRAAP